MSALLSKSEIHVPQWSVVHETIKRTWEALNGAIPMPPTFPNDIVNALDDNLKIMYFDLLNLYDISEQIQYFASVPSFRGYFGTLQELLNLDRSNLRLGFCMGCGGGGP